MHLGARKGANVECRTTKINHEVFYVRIGKTVRANRLDKRKGNYVGVEIEIVG